MILHLKHHPFVSQRWQTILLFSNRPFVSIDILKSNSNHPKGPNQSGNVNYEMKPASHVSHIWCVYKSAHYYPGVIWTSVARQHTYSTFSRTYIRIGATPLCILHVKATTIVLYSNRASLKLCESYPESCFTTRTSSVLIRFLARFTVATLCALSGLRLAGMVEKREQLSTDTNFLMKTLQDSPIERNYKFCRVPRVGNTNT